MAIKSLTKKYDVISVSHYFYPRVGGLENMAYNVLKDFAQRGLKCLAVHGNGTSTFYQLSGFDCQSFHPYKMFSGTYPVFGPTYGMYMLKLLRHNPQALVLIYDRHLTSSFITAIACKLTGHKYVLIHQTTNSSYFRSPVHQFIANMLDRTIIRWVTLWAHKSISVSEANKQFMIEQYGVNPDTFTTINNGFSEELLNKFQVQPKEKIVVFAAKWIQVKDPDTVARAYLELARAHSDWQFMFAGEGDCILKGRTDLPENIDIIPRYFTQMELWQLFSRSAIYINASLHEGLAITLVEAAVQGNMLVVSDAPSNVELNGKLGLSGNVFTRGSSQELAAKIEDKIRMFGTEAHKQEIARTIELARERFSNTSIMEQYAAFVRDYSVTESEAKAVAMQIMV